MGSITQPEMSGKFAIKEVQAREEMDQVMDVIWKANYYPYEPFAQLVFPVLGYTTADREAAIIESKQRFWHTHKTQNVNRWFYIEDSETRDAVGCVQWEIVDHNRSQDRSPKLTACWWPSGEYREFAELILSQAYACRALWMKRRHLGAFNLPNFCSAVAIAHDPSGEQFSANHQSKLRYQ